MEIIRATEGLTKKEIYGLSRSPEIEKMRDHVNEIIDVDKYLIYSDTNGSGDTVTVLSIMDKSGKVVASNSATARVEFEYIADLMEDEAFSVKICEGVSKNGRSYITLAMI